ncbi:hypothetical protein C6W27_01185 [Bacillus paralicheniformis]|nr:hypothetical protein BV582_10470 [Bacillus paralicheniformis]POO77960.1 hypothetical protein C1T30_34115 [Bacillus sp. MBGLi97]PRS18512.1 hypothetical protein C6W27_01185 [Bacillus paralicheniformis]TAI52424.1 hypothetical protein CXP52_08745 [Bacillus paralicheniformis]
MNNYKKASPHKAETPQIVDKIPKRLFVLGFCHLFSVIENLCSLGRPSIGAERMLEFVSTDAQT